MSTVPQKYDIPVFGNYFSFHFQEKWKLYFSSEYKYFPNTFAFSHIILVFFFIMFFMFSTFIQTQIYCYRYNSAVPNLDKIYCCRNNTV